MSIRTKVIGCLLAILFLFAGVSYYNYARSQQSNARLALVNELFLPLSRQVAQLQSNVQGLADDMRRFYFQPESTSESSTFSRMVRDLYPYIIHKKFTVAERLLISQDNGEKRAVVGELSGLLNKASDLFDELAATTDKSKFDSLYVQLRMQLLSISKRVDDECQKITLTAQAENRKNRLSSLALSLFVMLLGAFTLFLSYRVLNPLPLLIQTLKKITDGDFDQSLKVKRSDKDEVAELAREFNRMLAALRERDQKIQHQQKELLQSERLAAIGQLSAEVVHEIRNPLNAISLNIDWLESELGQADSEITKTLRSVSREIERLNQITESYLVRARVPAQETPKAPINEVLREILDFEREAGSRGIVIETDFASQEIFVRTDRSRLKQAFLNVFKNAKEAMPRGGKISVRTELKDNVYEIKVADSGCGMNDSIRRKTFQPFFTTKPNGTGIGLMLTKDIVEEAQGTLHCDSALGKGTTFTFQFPV